MSRSFDGLAANYIRCAVGSCGPAGTGAYTMISLVRKDAFQNAGCTYTVRRTSTNARDLIETGLKLFGVGDFSSGFGPLPAGDGTTWTWMVERKAAGAAHYRMAYAQYPVVDPNVDIVFGEAPDAANHTDPGVGDEIWLGEGDLHARGLQALHVLYTADLTDAQIKSGLTTALSDLMALSPVGAWPLNQSSPAETVVDVTGNGANELSTVGTVGVGVNPPSYNFSLAPVVSSSRTHIFLGSLRRRLARKPQPLVLRPRLANASSQTQVKYRFGGLARKWRFTMLTERLSVTSLERVQTVVRADADGRPYDPRNASVEFAFLTSAVANPAGADWKTGSWDVTRIGEYVAQVNIGPGGAATLAVGEYYTWIRLNDSVAGEIPVEPIAKLIVS